jgi:hypothetical protein
MDQNFRHRPAFGRFGLVRRFGAPGDSSSVPMLSSGRFRCDWRTSERFPSFDVIAHYEALFLAFAGRRLIKFVLALVCHIFSTSHVRL